MTNYMTMMFEVDNLAQASPATVSRCGMVYMQDKIVTHKFLIDSFIIKDKINKLN